MAYNEKKQKQDNNHSRVYSYVKNKRMVIFDDVHHRQSHRIAIDITCWSVHDISQ